MMGKRNAYALAAQQRKAGAHSEAKRPEKDVFDHINEYEEAEMSELQDRVRNMQSCQARHPDEFDRILTYTDEQLKELYERKGREIATGKAPLIEQDFGVGDRVRVRVTGPFLWCEGLVVKRDENIHGDPVWTVDMEGAGIACFLTHELDRRTS